MRALVTGAAGFLGRHVSAALGRRGYDVDNCDLSYGSDCMEWFATKSWGQGLGAWGAGFDVVVHAAALVDGRESIEGQPARVGAYNAMLDSAMFDWALRAKPRRIIYLSSSAVYPANRHNSERRQSHETEGGPIVDGLPDQSYGWVKRHGEYLASLVRKAALDVTVVRPFSVYGVDQDARYPFPAILERTRSRRDPLPVWGNGQQTRDFIHVDDAVAAILAVADAGVDFPVNVGTGIPTTIDELAGIAMRAAGYSAPIEHVAGKPVGVVYRVADPTRMRWHYQPKITLEQGVWEALNGRR